MTDVVCIGYVRCSTVSQVLDGDGLAMQRERIERWVEYQGLRLVEVAEDAGLSGSTMERPGLRRALRQTLDHAPGAALVVYKLDRLGRNAIDVQETLAVLLDAGVRVVAIADGVDSASGMGAALLKLLTNILATFAELEKEGIRTRLLDGRRRADATNRPYASEPRYGRRPNAEGTALAICDEEGAAIARMHELRTAGLSYRAIASTLDAEGHRPRRAARWSSVVVGRIVTGRRSPKKANASRRIARARAELLAE
ncbi:MAG: site-specific recombinase [Actinomycetota bacterium]|jgi:DNA invertase Pin-like site-specific DNA recombinase